LTIERATEKLIEDGYLPEGASHDQARNLIKRSLNNPQYTPEGTERMAEQEAQAAADANDAEQEAIALANEAEDNALDIQIAAFEAALLDLPTANQQSDMGLEDALLAAGYTEQEIQNDRNSAAEIPAPVGNPDARAAGALAQADQGTPEAAPGASPQGNSGRASAPGSIQGQDQGLTAPSQQEVLDQQERKDKGEKANASQRKAEQERLRLADERKDIAKASEAAASTFELGGDAEQNLSGQGGMFDAPADPVAETKATLDANNVTGKERLDVIKDVKAGTLTAAEVKEAYPVKSAAPANTENAGEELTANKRNRIKTGINWADIAGKDDALRVRETTKTNVSPKPDYQAMVDGGMEPVIAHIVKQAYDAIATTPNIGNRVATDEDLKTYISGVQRYMTGVMDWANDKAKANAWIVRIGKRAGAMMGAVNGQPTSLSAVASEPEKSLYDTVYPEGWKAQTAELRMIGGNKPLAALQPSSTEAMKGMKDIGKGWPGKVEAWQKQGYRVVQGNEIGTRFYTGDRRGAGNYVSATLQMKIGNRTVDLLQKTFDGAQSPQETAVQEWVKQTQNDLNGKYLLLDKNNRLVGTRDTEAEAKERARELTKRDSKTTVSDKGISVEAAEREGIEHRMPGEDISSDRLKEAFGFKGVNFGTWMLGKSNEKERQLHLNHAFDSFMDLAGLLNVPPKALSLDGMLGLAIGAQGTGSAAAHFVPGVNEINLTRTSGAGSLAHEFGHALDHYFARQAGLTRNTDPFLTEYASKPVETDRVIDGRGVKVKTFGENIRPEIVEAFKGIVQAMNKRMTTAAEAALKDSEALARSKKSVDGWLANIRSDFDRLATSGVIRDNKKETAPDDLMANYDALAEKIKAMALGDGKIAAGTDFAMSQPVSDIRDLYKSVTGRTYSLDQIKGLQSNIDALQYRMDAKADAKKHVPQMVTSDYAKAADLLDKDKKGKGYWSTNLEKFARAFDAFVSDKLEAKAVKNTYLSHVGRTGDTVPAGTERTAINEGIQKLVDTIQTKETDKGLAMFSLPAGKFESLQIPAATVEWMGFDKPMQVTADLAALTNRHPEAYSEPSEVRADIQFVMDKPDGWYIHSGRRVTLFREGDGNAVPQVRIELERAGNAMIVRSVYVGNRRQIAKKMSNKREELARIGLGGTLDSLSVADYLEAVGNESLRPGQPSGDPADALQNSNPSDVEAQINTAASVRAALTTRFGDMIARMEKRGFLKIWDGIEQFNKSGQSSRQIKGAAQGKWDGKTAHLFADGIPEGQEVAVMLHEVGEHASMQKMLGPKAYKRLVARAHELMFADDPTAMAAVGRIPENTPERFRDSELLAYMIETVAAADAKASPGARKWLSDMLAAIRAWWSTTGLATKLLDYGIRMELTPKDIAALAVRAVKWQDGQTAPVQATGDAAQTFSYSADQANTPSFKAWYGDWQNAGDEQTRSDSGVSTDLAASAARRGSMDAGRAQDVNAVQRRGGMGAAGGVPIVVGEVHFTGAAGPVGEDGKPVVFFHGTREDIAVFQLNHPGRHDKGWLGRGVYATNSADLADLYAEQKRGSGNQNVMPLYMAVRNPYVTTNALKIRLKNASQAQIDSYTQQLKDAGHDGVVMAFEDGHVELMAFEPTQVKSATGNNGNFDPANPDIRYSRPAPASSSWTAPPGSPPVNPKTGALAPQPWNVAEPGTMDNAIRAIQNNKIDLKRVQEGIAARLGAIPDSKDAYLSEELYQGKVSARVEALHENTIMPLLKKIAVAGKNLGITLDDVNQYLHARHAPERNAAMKAINPGMANNDALSGMSDAQAATVMADFGTAGKSAGLTTIAKDIDQLTSDTRNGMVADGLEDASAVTAWEAAYKHYVPLQRDIGEPGRSGTPRGMGISIRGPEAKRATGSDLEVVNILANIVTAAETAAIRAEKAIVGRTLLAMAKNYPNPDFWKVDIAPTKPRIDAESGLVIRDAIDPMYQTADNVVMVKDYGQSHFIVFNKKNERAVETAKAMKNLDIAELGKILQVASKGTRFIASLLTQRNPLFWMTNFARDVQGVMINLEGTDAEGLQATVLSNIPKAMKGMHGLVRDGKNSQWSRYAKELQEAGGTTGYMQQFENSAARMKDLQNEVDRMGQGKADPRRLARLALDFIDDYNDIIENGTRLAVFQAARDAGVTTPRAASIAKNITVNFNRKGNLTPGVNALYMFFNASVQGTARLAIALASSRKAQVLVGAVATMGFLLDALNRAMSDDDEETGRNRYDMIPEFEKSKNWIFMNPMKPGQYVKVPLPLGPHVFHNAGRLISDAMFRKDKRNAAEYGWSMASTVLDAFSPLGITPSLGQLIAPSILDPILQVAENKSFTGGPVYKSDQTGFGKTDPKPAYTRHFENTPDLWKAASRGLNDITGGDKDKPGKINIEPDILKHVFYAITGGPGRTLDQATDASQSQARGEAPTVNRIPFVSRFYGENDDRQRQRVYYDDRKRAADAKTQHDYFAKIGRADLAREVAEDLGDGDANKGRRMMHEFNSAQSSVGKINKAIRHELQRQDNGEDRTKELTDLKKRRVTVMGQAGRADDGE
jgi:hypothetical protein